jgi:NADPH-dependent 2,4-dienoyl-CoA reductase/sulfur reductase-like enzyme
MKTFYHGSIYDDTAPVPSYWETTAPPPQEGYTPLVGEETCDVAVIGGGYTGLSAALHLARDHGVDVRVLESGHIGWGSSGWRVLLPAGHEALDPEFDQALWPGRDQALLRGPARGH